MTCLKNCAVCGSQFEAVGSARYCSKACREVARNSQLFEARAISREKRRAEPPDIRSAMARRESGTHRLGLDGDELERYVRGERFSKRCVVCGNSFATNRTSKLTCSPYCSAKRRFDREHAIRGWTDAK